MNPAPLRRILLVEDDPDVMAVVRFSLERLGGYTVRVCESPRRAVDAALSFEPDLVLMDVMMPDMDGMAVLAAMRREEALTRIPVVFLTALPPQECRELLDLPGVAARITKPFNPMELSRDLERIWASRSGAGQGARP